jgi:hypothetical protein
MRKLSLVGGLIASAAVALAWASPGLTQGDPTGAAGPSDQPNLPPGNVLAQVSFGSAGGGDEPHCILPAAGAAGTALATEPGAGNVTCDFEIEQYFDLAVYGPWSDQPVTFDITRPDGAVTESVGQTETESDGTVATLYEVLRPGEPFGSYQVAASQDGQEVDGTFTVVPASQPVVDPEPSSVEPGDSAQILLAGFAPNSSIPLYRYVYLTSAGHGPTPTFWFNDVLGQVKTDQYGQGSYTLQTSPSDPITLYGFLTDPPVTTAGSVLPPRSDLTVAPTGQEYTLPPDRDDLLVQLLVTQADQDLAQVACGCAPDSILTNDFTDPALSGVTSAIQQLSAKGLSQKAQLQSVTIRTVNPVPNPVTPGLGALAASVDEVWNRRLVDGSDNLVQVLPSHLQVGYLLIPTRGGNDWRIAGVQTLGQS